MLEHEMEKLPLPPGHSPEPGHTMGKEECADGMSAPLLLSQHLYVKPLQVFQENIEYPALPHQPSGSVTLLSPLKGPCAGS